MFHFSIGTIKPERQTKSENIYSCEVCGTTTTRKGNLKRHMLNKHEVVYKDANTIDTRRECNYPNCVESFFHTKDLIKHLAAVHSVNIQTVNVSFRTEKYFFEWKEQEQISNFVYFSKQTCDTVSTNTRNMYYICQHDGSDRAHRKKGDSARKTQKRYSHGQVKTGSFCPARMTAKMNLRDMSVEVQYVKSHNHPIDVSNTVHQPIPDSIHSSIKRKLSIGMPVNDIYREFRSGLASRDNRETTSEDVTKVHLLKNQIYRTSSVTCTTVGDCIPMTAHQRICW